MSIRYATTPQHFAVAVRDRFGTLEKAHILNYLEKCLRSPNQIDRKTYGAGLGLYLIANNAAQFIVNLAPGMASEVVCTFDRKGAKVPLKILVLRAPWAGGPPGRAGPRRVDAAGARHADPVRRRSRPRGRRRPVGRYDVACAGGAARRR